MPNRQSAFLFTLCFLFLSACSQQDGSQNNTVLSDSKTHTAKTSEPDLMLQTLYISDAYIREPVPGNTTAVGYFQVNNPTDSSYFIIGASSNTARAAEIHEHSHSDGQMRMRRVKQVEVAPNKNVMFKPGGLHVMLFDFSKSFAKDAANTETEKPAATLSLALGNGQTINVAADIRSILD